MIAIVDYGAGNISSVKKALEHLQAEAQVTSDPAIIAAAEKIIVPGVGHFSRCQSLNENLRACVLEPLRGAGEIESSALPFASRGGRFFTGSSSF